MTDTLDRIRSVLPIGQGQIVLAGWPGLRVASSGVSWIDPEAVEAALSAFAALDAAYVIGLCETADLPTGATSQLRRTARERHVRLVHAPIRDYAAPDAGFLRVWHSLAPILHQRIESGGAVALCCSFGAGRSGTVAALMLHEQGCAMPEAIRRVRAGFYLAIESPAQERWLMERF
ncbi:MAG: hypothetical protein LC676_18905 [Loktanella sp.]|nr:hypothetical protein [Loktanella sp.]